MTFEVLKELSNSGGSTLEDYKFLYGFISLVKPKRILDIGTNYGLSAIAMAMALRDCKLEKSKILTIDINHAVLEVAGAQIHDLGLIDINHAVLEVAGAQIHDLGLSSYVEIRCCSSSALDPKTFFDVVFIDGSHTFEGCMLDFNNVKGRTTYVLVHDLVSTGAIKKAMKTIGREGKHEILNIDIGGVGMQWSRGKIVYRSYPGIAVIKVGK